MTFEQKLAKEVYFARTRAGFTQEELAERVGVSTRMIQYYERGAMKPSLEGAMRLMAVLELDARLFYKEVGLRVSVSNGKREFIFA